MPEPCNSRPFSCLMKSCFPNPHTVTDPHNHNPTRTTISSLPDDLLLECLSRVPKYTIPILCFVSKRWLQLSSSPSFFDLRRRHSLLTPTLFCLCPSNGLFYTLCSDFSFWKLSDIPPSSNYENSLLVSLAPTIFIINHKITILYDAWTRRLSVKSPMLHPRKKFAAAAINGKIYIAAGGGGHGTVEEYDPDVDTWRVVSHAPRKRYGCVGVAVGNVFFIIGGLKLGEPPRAGSYASTMDLYDVAGNVWLKSKALPSGGCVVAACALKGFVIVLASHAVELSFWKLNACVGSEDFGTWTKLKTPPLPVQVRLDSSVRFCCVGIERDNKVVLIQLIKGRQTLVFVYDFAVEEWSRMRDIPAVIQRASCVCVEC